MQITLITMMTMIVVVEEEDGDDNNDQGQTGSEAAIRSPQEMDEAEKKKEMKATFLVSASLLKLRGGAGTICNKKHYYIPS